jgi:hypothetical protein
LGRKGGSLKEERHNSTFGETMQAAFLKRIGIGTASIPSLRKLCGFPSEERQGKPPLLAWKDQAAFDEDRGRPPAALLERIGRGSLHSQLEKGCSSMRTGGSLQEDRLGCSPRLAGAASIPSLRKAALR